jgi:hypothetical protein
VDGVIASSRMQIAELRLYVCELFWASGIFADKALMWIWAIDTGVGSADASEFERLRVAMDKLCEGDGEVWILATAWEDARWVIWRWVIFIND